MKPIVTELVGVILARLEEQRECPVSEAKLRTWLRAQGYTKGDIDAAIKALGTRFSSPPAVAQCRGTVRTLSVYEAYKLTPKARDALARLELRELIDAYQRELLLDHLSHFEGEVDLPELDYLLSWLICAGRDVEFQQCIGRIIQGDGEIMH